MIDFDNAKKYVLSILCSEIDDDVVSYRRANGKNKKIHIVENSFWCPESYGTLKSLPKEPFLELIGVEIG